MRLYGKRPVMERIKAAPHTIRTLILQQGIDASDLVHAAKTRSLHLESVPKAAFTRMTREVHAQGVLAEVETFQYVPLEELLKPRKPDQEGSVVRSPLPEATRSTLFLLDRITDPQNLGAILRTTACLGGFALVLPKHESSEVNETVLRVACGGENYTPVARVTNLVQACELAKKAGYWIAGATSSGATPLQTADWPTPLGIVLGSEGGGIRPGLKKHLNLTLTVPMPGADLSFNVATACALIAYEITRRKLKTGG